MPIQKRQSALMTIDWIWDSDAAGAWAHNTLSVAAQCEAARRLASIDITLRQMHSLILQLGTDGIHELIRLETTSAKRRERNLKTAAKRRRSARAESR